MRVSLEEELLLDALGKDIENLESISGKACLDELILSVPVRKSVELSCLLACEELVDLSDESGELRNELYDTLRDDCNTEVVTVSCSLFVMSARDIFLAATSSPMRQMLGCVSSAHSRAT